MSVFLNPVGLAAAPVANSLSLGVTYKEHLCRCVCSTSTNQPTATVTYDNEQPVLNGGTVFVPIVATLTIVTPSCGCNAQTQVIKERFIVEFQGQTAVPTAVNIAVNGRVQGLFKIVCGKSNNYAVNDSLIITITPPAA